MFEVVDESLCVTIQLKAFEMYFPVVITMYAIKDSTFKVLSMWTESYNVTIRLKPVWQFFPMILFSSVFYKMRNYYL